MSTRIFLVRLRENLTTYATKHNRSVATYKATQTLIKNIDKQIADLPKIYPNGKKIPQELSDKMAEMLHTAIMIHHSEDGHDSDVVYDGTDEAGLSEMNDEELVEEFLLYFGTDNGTPLNPIALTILKQLASLGYGVGVNETPVIDDKDLQCLEDGERRIFEPGEHKFLDAEWWGEDQYELVKVHFDQPCTIVCLSTFTALGELDFEYYDIKFDDGVVLEAISGLHLHNKA